MDRSAALFVVLNARSGSRDAAADRATIARLITEAGREHHILDILRTEDIAPTVLRAATLARERGGIVAVAGGDGTINAAAQVALELDVPFGVVPRGTFNYFSRSHGIPLDTEGAVANLLHGETRNIQVGLVNGRIFLVNASIGLYARVLQDREYHKRRYGRSRLVALVSAVHTLLREHRPLLLRYECDRRAMLVRTPTVFVGNNPLQLADIGVPEASDVEGGDLAALIPRPRGRGALFRLLLRGAAGELGTSHDLMRFAFRCMTISPRLPALARHIKVATDGELALLATPLRFEVSPRPLRLVAPRQA